MKPPAWRIVDSIFIFFKMYPLSMNLHSNIPICLPPCTKKNDSSEWFPDDIRSDSIKYKVLTRVQNKVFLTQNKEKSPRPP